MIHRLARAIPIAVVLALAVVPSGAMAYTPSFTVEASSLQPWAGEAVTITVRTFGDPAHTVPGREDELSRAFGMATMDNLLVARSDAVPAVPIELHRIEIDRYEGTITLPAGDWLVEAFPDRTGWSSPSLPPGYPEPISVRVVDRDAIEGLAGCPVSQPMPVPASFAERLFGSAAAFGNDDLWVGGIGRDGVILADPRMVAADGTIGWKLGWWRVTPGDLSITGRRLDGDAAPLRAMVPDGYGASGFQATGVDFPATGCWELTGVAGGAQLSFVTFVTVR